MRMVKRTAPDVTTSRSPMAQVVAVASALPADRELWTGNQATLRRLSRTTPHVQCKLQIGAVHDPLEAEADRVADQVMRMPDPVSQPTVTGGDLLQRKCAECEEEEKGNTTAKLSRQESGGAAALDGAAAPPIVHDVLGSPGQPLDAATKAFFEPRFGADLGSIRVHDDEAAGCSAQSVGAIAYSAGREIVFAPGQYNPSSLEGQKLIAHELSHTLQQAAAIQRQVPGEEGGAKQTDQAPALADANQAPASGDGGVTPTGAGPGSQLNIEFDAFIPGSLGSAFESFDHPTDLKNQPAFDAAIKAIPGTWLKEPGSFSAKGSGPWCYATDNRGFGGGSHRVGFTGTVATSDIGNLAGKKASFNHTTSGSTHVRWTHTGWFTSSGETGSVDGPNSKSAPVKSSENAVDNSLDESIVTTTAAASYPFSSVSPDIDYQLVFDFKRDSGGKTLVKFEVTNNLFPYYELLINGGTVWNYTSSSTGPGNINLRRSTTFKSGWWPF